MSAGSSLFVAASRSGKRRRDRVTPKSDSDSDDSVFARAPVPPGRVASKRLLAKTQERCSGRGWRRPPNSWEAWSGALHQKTPRACWHEQHLPWTAFDEGRRYQDGCGDADVGPGDGRPHKWPQISPCNASRRSSRPSIKTTGRWQSDGLTILAEVAGARELLLKGLECTENLAECRIRIQLRVKQHKFPCRSQNHITQQNTSENKHMVSTQSLAIHSYARQDKLGTPQQPPTMRTISVKTL